MKIPEILPSSRISVQQIEVNNDNRPGNMSEQ